MLVAPHFSGKVWMAAIRIANAPCSWGSLEFEGLEGEAIQYEQMLDELKETGYEGTELGDWGYMPITADALPKRFMRVRGYGLLANRGRKKRLQKARAALGQFEAPEPQPHKGERVEAFMLRVTGIDIRLCPRCRKGRMQEVAELPPVRGPPIIGSPEQQQERLF